MIYAVIRLNIHNRSFVSRVNMFGVTVLFAIVGLATSSVPAPTIKLNNGREFPALGLGTWLGPTKEVAQLKLNGNEVEESVVAAIEAGYRHIDTAAIYSTEEQVGRGIKRKISDGTIKREDIFVTTKLWNEHHAKEAVLPALKESLTKLNLSYVDLYLIHWPVALNADKSLANVDFVDTWQGMVEALNSGLTKAIGVSNFNQQQLERVINSSSVTPAVLQIELNLNLQQPALREFCKEHNIVVTGYTPFGSLFYSKAKEDSPPPRIDDPALKKIAEKYNKTVPQIALRYLVEIGVVPIPKSLTKARVVQNFEVFDFSLTQDEKDLLKSYDKGYRTLTSTKWIDSPYYPFEK